MPTKPNYNYLIIVPAYNACKHLPELIKRVEKAGISKKKLLFINDGSTDTTFEYLTKNDLNFLNNKENKGKGFSLKKAFDQITQKQPEIDFVITMDSDLQHEPEFLPGFIEMYKKAKGNLEIILGNRLHNTKAMPLERILSNKLTSFFVSIMCGVKILDSQSGYRLLSTEVLKTIKLQTNNYETESELLLKAARKGFRIGHLPISTVYGDETSSIRHFQDTMRFLKMYFNFFRGKL